MMLPAVDTSAILKLRQQILARNEGLQGFGQSQGLNQGLRGIGAPAAPEQPQFGSALSEALRSVSSIQDQASAATNAYETGQTHDLASVMIARQKAAIAFEATLQARNRLVGAYKDVMNMPL
jgi:flagellar hook-basal body complex protein FliE